MVGRKSTRDIESGAEKRLVIDWKARARKAEARVAKLERERDDARAGTTSTGDLSLVTCAACKAALAATQGRSEADGDS